MKKIIVKICMLAIATAMVFAVTACNKTEISTGELPEGYEPVVEGKITVTCRDGVYSNESSRKAIRNWLNAFLAKNPDVSIETNFSVSNYDALISSKSMGDVYFLTDADLYDYAITSQALMPLDYYVEAFNIDVSNVYSGIYELCKCNGKLYFAGFTCGNITFVYNVDALMEAGILAQDERIANDWTWEDYKVYAEQLKEYEEDGITLTQAGMALPMYWSMVITPFMYGYGGEWYDTAEKKVTLFNDGVKKGISEAINAIDNRWIVPTGINKSGSLATETKNITAESGSVFRYISAYTVLTESTSSWNSQGVTWDIAPFPLFSDCASSPCGTLGFGVFSYTTNKDAAAALVLSLYTEEGQMALHGQEGGDVPILKQLGEQSFWHLTKEGYEDKNYDAFTANYEKYVPGQICAVLPPEISSIVEDGMKDLFESYCTNGASWEDKLQEIQTQANEKWESIYD